MDAFSFDLNAKKVRFIDSELLDSLRKFAEINNNEYFTTISYDSWRDKIATSNTIVDRFGSWNKALIKIGIEGGREREYSTKELIDNLMLIWQVLKYPPGKRQLTNYGRKISERPYIRNWGSVKNACEQIALYKKGDISEDELYKIKNENDGIPEVEMEDTRKIQKASSQNDINPKLRSEILRRDNYKCVFCGRSSSVAILQVDHIIPRSLIKRLCLSEKLNKEKFNLCTACDKCNVAKKDFIQSEDIEHYFQAFTDINHPNYPILEYLQKIKDLQKM